MARRNRVTTQGRGSGIGVEVRNGDIDTALKIFKKKVKNARVLVEYKERMEFVKPSKKKRRERYIKKERSKKYSGKQFQVRR